MSAETWDRAGRRYAAGRGYACDGRAEASFPSPPLPAVSMTHHQHRPKICLYAQHQ